MSKQDSVQALIDLGFTELEAEVYSCLLQESPATGYRVSQVTGRLPGNVYKALETLEAKGAVIIDEGSSRMCRAVPAAELISMMRRKYQEREARAIKVLSELRGSDDDDRVYQLRTREQVFERCRAMLSRAKQVAVMDLFPETVDEVKIEAEEAAARGVSVHMKLFVPREIEGAHVVVAPRGKDIVSQYPGQWVILIVDACELLVASLATDSNEVHQAIWTSSLPLSYMFHSSMGAEMIVASLFAHIDSGTPIEDLQAAIAPFVKPDDQKQGPPERSFEETMKLISKLYSRKVRGFQELWDRFGGGHPDAVAEKAETPAAV